LRAIGLHHIDLRVSDYAGSVEFYDQTLIPLGFRRAHIKEETVTYYLRGPTSIGIRPLKRRKNVTDISYSYNRAGLHHIAISVARKREVDEFHELLKKLGIPILYPPRRYDRYAKGYYSVFFLDPDGIDLEVVYWPYRPSKPSG
jgi:catechol 2,3-dioxygenase-like lactoylglutathione lyase family enzyme